MFVRGGMTIAPFGELRPLGVAPFTEFRLFLNAPFWVAPIPYCTFQD